VHHHGLRSAALRHSVDVDGRAMTLSDLLRALESEG